MGLRERKRAATRAAISETALQLTAQLGFSQWTVEQLCEQVGISRRTFFNYFPTKEDALVGHRDDDIPDDLAEAFLAGTGSLLDDLVELACALMDRITLAPEELGQLAQAITSDPSLFVRLAGTAQEREDSMAELIAAREGYPIPDSRAAAASLLFARLSHRAAEIHLRDGAPYRETLTDFVAAARTLFIQ